MQALTFWLPALTGMMCLGFGAGLIGVYGFFVGPLSSEFEVGTATINLGAVALLLVPGIVSPFVGKLADRLPVRRLVLVGVSLAMSMLLAISYAPTLLVAGLCFVFFSLGLTFYGPVVVNGMVVKLYPRREARALAIVAIGISLASASLPPLMGVLLSHLDWRTALACLAVGVWILLVLASQFGLPAGVAGPAGESAGKVDSGMYRQPAFWLIGLCVAMGLSVSVILAVVYPPYFISEGYTLKEAGWFLSLAGMSGLVGKVSVAWLGDTGRHYAKWLAMALLSIQIIGFGVLLQADSTLQTMAALSLLGFGGGAFIPMHPYLNSRYFDAGIISQVIGAQMPIFLPFGLVGAPLAGYVYDRTGSYDLVLVGLACLLALAMLVALRLPLQQE